MRLAQLAAHLVVALIALVGVGGATRVMEAGLACPDWPLCYGSLFPGQQMNIQVFLEWFHRVDAFVVALALLAQFFVGFIWRSELPKWLPWINGAIVILVAFQGGLGALTVLKLLPVGVVTAHLVLALTLVAVMSGLTQALFSQGKRSSPFWWRFMAGGSLVSVISQSLLGGRMASDWATQRCLMNQEACYLLDLHRSFSLFVALFILAFVVIGCCARGWPRDQWPYLLAVLFLLITQLCLGILSVQFGLSYPLITIGHQLIAALLVAFLAALTFRQPKTLSRSSLESAEEFCLDQCNG